MVCIRKPKSKSKSGGFGLRGRRPNKAEQIRRLQLERDRLTVNVKDLDEEEKLYKLRIMDIDDEIRELQKMRVIT